MIFFKDLSIWLKIPIITSYALLVIWFLSFLIGLITGLMTI